MDTMRPMIIAAIRKARAAITHCGNRGAVVVEFAIVLPVLLLLVLGMIEFGIIMNAYVTLANAAGVTAMQFAASRSDVQPVTDALTAVNKAAPWLTQANLTVSLYVAPNTPPNGTPCFQGSANATSVAAGNVSCATALTGAAPVSGTLQPAAVKLTYPCSPQLIVSLGPSCTLASTVSESVQ
jgi:Flp pilus assembly protein TadG